eukprot:TRINITY_DN8912_c0_g1_i1.p2 TRINITY_DN8912_c0_g1~~TRINITY_DN8912_c0_g1_i1.p2  ORF type:complete len:100 (+),score=2.02 TRINITY_DN8912_c0_g1_i1:395-694(+)
MSDFNQFNFDQSSAIVRDLLESKGTSVYLIPWGPALDIFLQKVQRIYQDSSSFGENQIIISVFATQLAQIMLKQFLDFIIFSDFIENFQLFGVVSIMIS